jgi:hypothetical protein
MNLDDLDDVTEEIREAVDNAFDNAELLATHVTGRVGEFYLTIDRHQYLVTIEQVEAPT